MGLFSKRPVLPDYSSMPLDQRLEDPAWYGVVSCVPGFDDATLVANADRGQIMALGSLRKVGAGILTVTPERVGYAYACTHEISQITQPVHKAELRHDGDTFVMVFGGPQNVWAFESDDHGPYLSAFAQARNGG